MAAWILFGLFLVMFSLSLLLVMARRKPATHMQTSLQPVAEVPEPPPPPATGRYNGVEIRFAEKSCCEWVKQLRGARLLPHQARLFPLPLPECDAETCKCRYVHFEDRRGEDDRRIPFSTLTSAFGRFTTRERRSGEDRREGYVSQEMRIISDNNFGLSTDEGALAQTSARR